MREIVLARHPVPAAYVPRGCRSEHALFRRHATPARLRSVAAGEAVPLDQAVDLNGDDRPGGPRLHPCSWHAGRAWVAIGRDYGTGGRLLSMDARSFAGWLESETDGVADRLGGLAILIGTPLMGEETGGRHPRGTVLDPADIRREGGWDRERGSLDLLRFLEERILLIGGVPHLRLPGPLWSLRWPHAWCEPTHVSLRPAPYALTAGLPRLPACLAALGLPPPEEVPDGHGLTSGGTPVEGEPADGLEDMRLFGNRAPYAFLLNLGSAVRRWRAPHEDLMGPVHRLWAWKALGDVGAVRAEEAALVARDIVDAAEAAPRFFPNAGRAASLLNIAAYAGRYVLPLLAPEEPMDADDVAALAGMDAVPAPPPVPAACTAGLPLFDAAAPATAP